VLSTKIELRGIPKNPQRIRAGGRRPEPGARRVGRRHASEVVCTSGRHGAEVRAAGPRLYPPRRGAVQVTQISFSVGHLDPLLTLAPPVGAVLLPLLPLAQTHGPGRM
jgi:hypothetical protein